MNNYTPWDSLGSDISKATTFEEALELSGLTWGATKAPLTALLNVNEELIPKRVAKSYTITRDDTNEVIGITGKNFLPIQNVESFNILDTLAEQSEIEMIKAGELFGGESTFLVAKIPNKDSNNKDIDLYYSFRNSFTAKAAVSIYFTPVFKPSNTVLNVTVSKAPQFIKLRHTSKFDLRLQEAVKVLREGNNYFHSVQDQFNLLAEVPVDYTKLINVLDEVMPLPMEARPTKSQNARNLVEELFQTSGKANGMGLFLAVANYCDHHTSFKSTAGVNESRDENRFVSVMEGASQKLKTETLKAILS